MSILRVFLALAVACLCAPVGAAPLEAYGGLPTIEDVAISADASRLAAMVTEGDTRRIVVKRVSDGAIEANVQVGRVKARSIEWAGRDHLIITASTTGKIKNAYSPRSEWYTVVDLDMRDRKLYPLLNDAKDGVNVTTSSPMARMSGGKLALFIPSLAWVHSQPVTHTALFKADLDTHKATLVWAGERTTNRFVIDHEGEVVAQTTWRADPARWELMVRQGKDWRTVRTLDAKFDPPVLVGTGRTSGTVIVSEDTDDGKIYREIAIADGTWSEPFARIGPTGGLRYGPDHRLIGTQELVGDEQRNSFYDASAGRMWMAIQAAFPGQRVSLISSSDSLGKVVVYVDSPTEGPAYAFVDIAAKKAEWIGSAHQDLGPDDIAPVQPIRFKAADGLDLSGYLTLPKGRPAQRLPLVVLPHSGPDDRDTPGFEWLAQAIASRGYAVLQVNFRGSYGLGRDFMEAGFGEWGRKMQTDLSDGVRDLAAKGVIDPARVCIAGQGYGGYAALAGVAFEPGVYRCAVSIGGQSNVHRFLDTRSERSRQWWFRYAGAKGIMDGKLRDISPALHPAGVSAPVLLIHGKDDTVIPLEQSELMAAALKREGKPVEFETLPDEDHWLSRSETRLRALKLVMAFVEKHNPPN